MMGKKGQIWGVLVILVVLFLFAFLFMAFFPVFNKLDTVITPKLDGDWLNQVESWRKNIYIAPVIGVLLCILWLIIQWVKDQRTTYG